MEVELQNLHADHENTFENPNEYYVIIELVILDEELLNLHGDNNNTTIWLFVDRGSDDKNKTEYFELIKRNNPINANKITYLINYGQKHAFRDFLLLSTFIDFTEKIPLGFLLLEIF